ncbi:MAG: transposase [Pedobacter sp.]
MVERWGKVRMEIIGNDSYDVIAPLVKKHVAPEAHLMKDQNVVYRKFGPDFAGHEFVNHGKGE